MFEKGSPSSHQQSRGRPTSANNDEDLGRPMSPLFPRHGTNLDYSPQKSNVGTYPKEIELYPMEIRPLLKNDIMRNDRFKHENSSKMSDSTSVETNCSYPKECKTKIPRKQRQNYKVSRNKCTGTPDVYRNILGPTPDESILAGLQTVIDLCGLIDVCDPEDANDSEFASTDSSTLRCSRTCGKFSSDGQTSHRIPLSSGHGLPRVATSNMQPYSRHYDSRIVTTGSRQSIVTGTSYDSVRNDTFRTAANMSPTRSVISEQITEQEQGYRTAVEESNQCSGMNSCNDMNCGIEECCGPESNSVPCVRVMTKDGRKVCIKYKCKSVPSTLSSKCFPTVEIPPCNLMCSNCYSVGYDVTPDQLANSDCECPPTSSKKSSKCVVIQDPKAGESMFDPKPCNKTYQFPKDRKPKNYRCSRSILNPTVQPVVGVCTDGKCGTGDRVLHTRYAIVKISIFQNYTTYEIMKSSEKKPKKMSDCVEGIFVTKR